MLIIVVIVHMGSARSAVTKVSLVASLELSVFAAQPSRASSHHLRWERHHDRLDMYHERSVPYMKHVHNLD